MKYYDYIVSLGRSCHTAITLKNLNLQGETNVFDWSGGNLFEKCGVGGFDGKVNLICNNFNNFFNLYDFEEFDWDVNNKHKNVRNKRTGLQYLHDFSKILSIEESFSIFEEKYRRRIDRLYKKIEEARSVCFIFITWEEFITNEMILKAERKLNNKFGNKIDILVLQNNCELDDEKWKEEKISEKSTRIHFNNLCAPVDCGRYNYKLYQKIINEYVVTKYKLEFYEKKVEHEKMLRSKIIMLNKELQELKNHNIWKKMRYPRWFVKIVCCFIPKEKNRKRFRRKYTLAK